MPWEQISSASQCLFYSRHLRGSHPKPASLENGFSAEGNAAVMEFETLQVK